jgi:hypothetical protein
LPSIEHIAPTGRVPRPHKQLLEPGCKGLGLP